MLPFLEKALAAKPKPKKTGLSVVNVKKVVKAVESMGKTATTLTVSTDGSVTVSIGELSPADAPVANVWDKELQ
ncbi:hypothetical protein [Rhizobium sp. AG855]|uniref:hypothetical protein n=1 Tax=Rhizobium sp. AG855 TaxID=2183898 RepID=UPI000E75EB3A|nr:hypothetical protein [Rhizobium sp. AG855]RKE84904.1 hypothetical protein DFO46_1682 [Rhizobium sp. AG855]